MCQNIHQVGRRSKPMRIHCDSFVHYFCNTVQVNLSFCVGLKMATHSSTLAWKIPWTEKPGRLQSMGSQRVGHDWVISLQPVLICKMGLHSNMAMVHWSLGLWNMQRQEPPSVCWLFPAPGETYESLKDTKYRACNEVWRNSVTISSLTTNRSQPHSASMHHQWVPMYTQEPPEVRQVVQEHLQELCKRFWAHCLPIMRLLFHKKAHSFVYTASVWFSGFAWVIKDSPVLSRNRGRQSLMGIWCDLQGPEWLGCSSTSNLGEQWSSPKSPCSSSATTLPRAPGPWHLQLPQEDSSPMLHGPAHTVLMQSLLKYHFLRETFHKLPSLGQVCLWATLKDYDPFLYLSTLVIMHSWWNMDISQAICKRIL